MKTLIMNHSVIKNSVYLTLGWLSFALGVIGIFLPLMPTTVFWILAVWLWSRGAPHLMEKVYNNPRYGPSVESFMLHGVVSRKGKYIAIMSMAISYIILQIIAGPGLLVSLGVAILLISVAIWLFLRPETANSYKAKNLPQTQDNSKLTSNK